MALTDKERMKLIVKAHAAMKDAKKKSAVKDVFMDEEYGYFTLGLKVLGRLLIGKTAEEAGARRGKKED